MLQVRLLGQFNVQLNGEPVAIPSRPAQSLLAYLMLNAGTAQRRERLAGLLWPDSSESNARANLRQALWRLRKAIGADTFLTDKVSVTFDAGAAHWLDAAVLDAGAEPGDVLSTQALIERVSLYEGELLPGFYEEWVVWERERLNAVYEDRMQALLERLVEEERWQEVHDWGERWIAQGQVPEPAYRALMQAHAELGDQVGMAAVYQRCVQALEEELGVAPSRETADLYERLSAGERKAPAPVAEEPPQRKTNLPVPPTPFVGREALLAEIGARLEQPACRLLTLVGPGGSRKTRLALEAAARLEPDAYEHGVYFVSLAPLESVEEIVPTVAQAVGFTFYGAAAGGETVAPRQQLLDYLRNKSMLLVMDNFEHLLALPSVPPFTSPPLGQFVPRSGVETGGTKGGSEGGTQLVSEILQVAPGIRILATSRANLNVQEENLFPVAGMDYPEADLSEAAVKYSAVKLFLETARRAQPHFEAKADNLSDVVRICRLVDGMPLGILLAAGWVRTLSLAEIANEIETSLDFLETDVQGVPERQRSVRAVFDHSWRLLSAREGDVMAALSVFQGGFTRRAAQAVTGATLRELKGLVDNSLVAHTATGRYEIHELLRQYAADKLHRADRLRRAEILERSPTALEATRDRHSAYYVPFLVRRAEELKGPRQRTALAEIEADAENARAAWDRAVERGQVEWLDQGMEGLCLFYERTGRYERGDRACRRAAERLAETGASAGVPFGYGARVHARALTWRAAFHAHLGRIETARQLLRASLSLLDEPALAAVDTRRERAFVLRQKGNVTMLLGEYERARGLFEGSLALYRELGDRWGTAIALVGLGWTAWNLSAYAEAEGWQREGLALRRALGDQSGIAYSLYALSIALCSQGKSEEAGRLAREVIAISRATGDRINLAWGLQVLGMVLTAAGKFREACSVYEKSAAIWDQLESHAWKALIISHLADVQMHLGRYQDAGVRLQLSLRLARESGYKLAIGLSLFNLGNVALAEGAFAEAQRWFQELFTGAQASGLRGQMEEASYVLGLAERGQGNLGQAREHFSAGLKIAVEIWTGWQRHYWVAAIALLLADEGETERAVELYALANRCPEIANSQWWEDLAGKHIAAVAESLPPETVAAAQERGRARDMVATMEELLEELGE